MKHDLYLNGEWIQGEGASFQRSDLMSDSVIWQGYEATTVQIDTMLERAQGAAPLWAALSFEKRFEPIHHYRSQLEKHKLPLAEAISLSMGKPLWESLTEVKAMIGKIDLSVKAYHERTGKKQLSKTLRYHHKPHGVVAILSPFNFPGHLLNAHLIPALLAGNVVVVKGSEKTPLVSQMIFDLLHRAHFPKGVCQLLQGGGEVGRYLSSHTQIDALFFTGSAAVGAQLERQLKPGRLLALELGGNNPLIVGKIKDPLPAAWLTIQSAFLTSGQRCTSARRLIVVEQRLEKPFIHALIAMIGQIGINHFRTSPEPYMGPVVDLAQANLLLQAYDHLIKLGGKELSSLHPLQLNTPLLHPGVVDVTGIADQLPDEEYFGPLLQVIRVPTFEKALEVANQTSYGLSASLLSLSKQEHELYCQTVKTGILNWNTPTCGASSEAPFGGCKMSGNYHPSGYYAADYCAYPVVESYSPLLTLPDTPPIGITQWTK